MRGVKEYCFDKFVETAVRQIYGIGVFHKFMVTMILAEYVGTTIAWIVIQSICKWALKDIVYGNVFKCELYDACSTMCMHHFLC